jgi:hypothetical protein
LRIEIRIPLIRNRNVKQQICLLVSSEFVTDFTKCGMNIKPLVIQQQTFTVDPPKKYASRIFYEDHSRSAKFKKGIFIHCAKQKPLFFINTTLFLYLNSKNLIISHIAVKVCDAGPTSTAAKKI